MIYNDPTKKHDAILLVDCRDGNPNGDPDAGNQPRIDPETRHGLMSDACLKRKVRNYVAITQTDSQYKIFVEEGGVLRETIERGYTELKLTVSDKKKGGTPEQQNQVQDWLIENFYDIRMFGAVLSIGLKAGQVWGPLQVSWGRSVDPILPISATITRCATTEAKEGKDNKTMGRKELIPYGLYRIEIHYNPALSKASEADLKLFWEALSNCWEFDRSAARPAMNCQGLFVFSHESKWGNYASHKLFEKIEITGKMPVPRSIYDYEIKIDESMPNGVTLTRLI
ncbi:MAG: type I-C CRISPR-associated protein Cas7/Csd2 [Planktothrix sp.]|uniref:type I-C CRISPR-associated protein Cas7/Csd2 n=1 Tax=Planktothrix sp. TaxID=3088171 RepID=UPI0038D4ACC4